MKKLSRRGVSPTHLHVIHDPSMLEGAAPLRRDGSDKDGLAELTKQTLAEDVETVKLVTCWMVGEGTTAICTGGAGRWARLPRTRWNLQIAIDSRRPFRFSYYPLRKDCGRLIRPCPQTV